MGHCWCGCSGKWRLSRLVAELFGYLVSCEGMVFGLKLGLVVAIMVCFLMDVVYGFNYRWAWWLVELLMVRGDLLLISNANRKIDLHFFSSDCKQEGKRNTLFFF